MIVRIWHGWTNRQNARAYQHLLKEEVFINIVNRQIEGFQKIELLKREQTNEVEFITIMWFDSLEAVKSFSGKEYEKAVVPQKAQELLLRYDTISQHYELVESKANRAIL
jgi:heme-degrading monooxygenase HmoA